MLGAWLGLSKTSGCTLSNCEPIGLSKDLRKTSKGRLGLPGGSPILRVLPAHPLFDSLGVNGETCRAGPEIEEAGFVCPEPKLMLTMLDSSTLESGVEHVGLDIRLRPTTSEPSWPS